MNFSFIRPADTEWYMMFLFYIEGDIKQTNILQ